MASVLISAAHKSSGKTTLSIGLCAALRNRSTNRNSRVQAFKKGPDYIDPLWLSAASGRPCHNLDFYTMTQQEILHTLQHHGADADFSLIEANKGLYDGMALDGSDSNAALAKLTGSAVILVLDTQGMTRGIAPLLLGYQAFDAEVTIAGVILNRVGGERHAGKLRGAVEEYTDIRVLGAVSNHPDMAIKERHLGLMPSNEHLEEEAEQKIARIGERVADQVDVEGVFSACLSCPDKGGVHKSEASTSPSPRAMPPKHVLSRVAGQGKCTGSSIPNMRNSPSLRIAICRDAAFAFYYPGDLEALRLAGAEIIPVNTLTDSSLPAVDGLFIGGGFPETQMQALAANHSLRSDIRAAIEGGLPTYAECGGLMYLSRSLSWRGEQADMVGVIPADAVMHDKPQGRGYVRLRETADMPWPDGGDGGDGGGDSTTIHAHEFHYSALENLSATGRYAYRVLRGQGIDGEHDGWVYKNLLASYTHLRHTSRFPWAQRFVNFIRLQQHSAS